MKRSIRFFSLTVCLLLCCSILAACGGKGGNPGNGGKETYHAKDYFETAVWKNTYGLLGGGGGISNIIVSPYHDVVDSQMQWNTFDFQELEGEIDMPQEHYNSFVFRTKSNIAGFKIKSIEFDVVSDDIYGRAASFAYDILGNKNKTAGVTKTNLAPFDWSRYRVKFNIESTIYNQAYTSSTAGLNTWNVDMYEENIGEQAGIVRILLDKDWLRAEDPSQPYSYKIQNLKIEIGK